MQYSSSLAAMAMAIGAATALPAAEPQAPVPLTVGIPTYYYFKTQVQAAQPPQYNNLYLTAYHTGAGLSDATFSRGAPLPAHRGTFVGTSLSWFAPTPNNVTFGVQYSLANTNYAAWSPVTINGGAGTPVCDWFHSGPQLFTLIKYGVPVIPSSCAKVDLVAEVAPPVPTGTLPLPIDTE
ncbi:hypothetical protein BLS_000786 [Venturia inaequalis]|uniref:DUF7907 domain-containing protein n=1 Tax=Venturia inaequalis TaxID=5025 RepID=A0A8H3YIV7_VENIN|nr:hypothetical protein BLS_000786 [Venturia inaequalis]RDI83737.1 hypothetical protein Vi05172_g6349 [Venturia inaequalis]